MSYTQPLSQGKYCWKTEWIFTKPHTSVIDYKWNQETFGAGRGFHHQITSCDHFCLPGIGDLVLNMWNLLKNDFR